MEGNVSHNKQDIERYIDFIIKSGEFDEISNVVTPTIIYILLAIGLIGNILVIYVSFTSRRIIKHPLHSVLVLNLAISDVIYLITSAPLQAKTSSSPGWDYGPVLCPLLHFLSVLTTGVSIYTMMTLAIIRFLALVMPFAINKSMISTSGNRSGLIVVGVIWIITGALASPAAHGYRVLAGHNNSYVLECTWEDGQGFDTYAIVLFVFTFLLPLLLVVVIYSFIVGLLYRLRRRQETGQYGGPQEKADYINSTRLIFILVVGFVVCWFPFYLCQMLWISARKDNYNLRFGLLALDVAGQCSSYAHACINPIIYTFAAPGFRESIGSFWKERFSLNRLRSSFRRKSSPLIFTPRHHYSTATTRMLTVSNHEVKCDLIAENKNAQSESQKSGSDFGHTEELPVNGQTTTL